MLPLLEKYKNDFAEKVAAYFEKSGFEVEKIGQNSTITAKYKELTFSVEKSLHLISIQEGFDMRANIHIRNRGYAGGTMSIPDDEFLAAKARIQHQLNGIEKNIECYSNPEVYYEYNGRRYGDAEELINKIF